MRCKEWEERRRVAWWEFKDCTTCKKWLGPIRDNIKNRDASIDELFREIYTGTCKGPSAKGELV